MAHSRLLRTLAFSLALLPCLAQAPSGARIEGIVVDSISGAPVRRAVVQLRAGNSGPALSVESADYADVTGPDGAFHFERVPPGSYSLSYARSGYLTPHSSTGFSARSFRAAAGESITGLRYGLVPQAIVSGRVIDDEGDSVEGAQVTLIAYRYTAGVRRLAQMSEAGTTNDRGEYRIARVPAGKYLLQASLDRLPPGSALIAAARTPGGPLATYGSTFYPGVTDPARALRVELHAGQELAGTDIPLQRTTMVRVSGRLIGPDGTPMSRAMLMLASAQGRLPTGFGAPSDEAGNFVLKNVRSGSYILNATSNDGRSLSVPLDVGSSDLSGFIAQASPPLPLRGSVTVQDAGHGFNLAACGVSMRMADTGATAGTVRPKGDGSFSFESLPQGRYLTDVFCGGMGAYVQSITVGGEEVRGRDFELVAASSGVRIALRTDSATLSGTVETPDGAAVQPQRQGHPSVVLIPADARLLGVETVAPAAVSAKNSFDFAGLRPGEYLAVAFDDIDAAQLQDPEFLAALEPLGTRVNLLPGGTQTVTLKWNAWPAGN